MITKHILREELAKKNQELYETKMESDILKKGYLSTGMVD